jgi:hypothetical protein
MGKGTRQKKQERLEALRTAQVLKYMRALGPDDMVKWTEGLERIENATTEEEKQAETLALQIWLATKYEESRRPICLDCGRYDTCYRRKDRINQCKLFEAKVEKGSEDNENI